MEEGGCSRAFECAAQLLQQLAEQEGAPTAPALEECVARWTRLPYKANDLLGAVALDAVRHNANKVTVFAAYAQAVLLNEKLFASYRERERFFASIASAVDNWAMPVIDCMAYGTPDLEDLLYRTVCVIVEAFPPVMDDTANAVVTHLCVACLKVADLLDRPCASLLAVLELCLTKTPSRVHAALDAAGAKLWTTLWELYTADEEHVGVLLGFVQRVIITSESLTAELLRMVLVDHRADMLAALASKHKGVTVQALSLLNTLALCKHEVICDALVASGFVDAIATQLVVPRENCSIVHQYAFGIIRNVLEFAGTGAEERILGGGLVGWLRTSIMSVKPDTSAHAHLLDLVVFLSTKSNMERFTKDTNWAEFSAPLLMEAKERTPDPTTLADLMSKKKPPATNTGPVFCCVCNVSLTAYYMIENSVYCSDHRPVQCASCRAPLKDPEEMVQVGFLRYCKQHAPPSCVRCKKFVSRFMNIAGEGVVCVDCGAPKCKGCSQSIVQGQCVSFHGDKWHMACFVCTSCGGPLGEQFLMSADEKLVCLACGDAEKNSESTE